VHFCSEVIIETQGVEMRNYRLWFVRILAALSGVAFLVLIPVAPAAPPVQSAHPGAEPASAGYALQFYGNGVSDIDRVKVRIDPHTPADVGGDFTIEFWLKTTATGGTCAPGASGDGWITGRTIIDRDVYGGGDHGDYGIALASGRICFGVAQGASGRTIYGSTNVANGQWRHIAVTRNASSGQMQIFVDGQPDASGTGPTGDISYRNGRSTSYPNSDPFLVFGAEKHDAGAAFPRTSVCSTTFASQMWCATPAPSPALRRRTRWMVRPWRCTGSMKGAAQPSSTRQAAAVLASVASAARLPVRCM
jgi:hypothetical protein